MPRSPGTRTPARNRGARPIRVVIVDDHRSFAEALNTAMSQEPDIEVVGAFNEAGRALQAVRRHHPDVVLMDVRMPGTDGIAATRHIREASPETRVLMLTAFEDETVVARAVDAGAAGLVPKTRSIKEVAGSVRAAFRGEALMKPEEIRRAVAQLRRRREQEATVRARLDRLTPRETEILQLMADGRSPEDIAGRMGISRHTLRTHIQNVLFKLKVHSKMEALAAAIRFGKVSTARPLD